MKRSLYRVRSRIVRHVAEALIDRRVALFLGAGISRPMGLPDWNQLTRNLFTVRHRHPPRVIRPMQDADRIRFAHRSYTKYLETVQAALYHGVKVDLDLLHSNKTLNAIAAMAMNSRRGNARAIFTLNYDDLLERHLAHYGLVVKPVFENSDRGGTSDVIVYHAHGFLSSPKSPFLGRSSSLLLDQTSYSEALADRYDWWSGEMIATLKSQLVLFIGLSGEDVKFDAHLMEAKSSNYFVARGEPFWGFALKERPRKVDVDWWEKRGVVVLPLKNYHSDLPDFLFSVCQAAASLA